MYVYIYTDIYRKGFVGFDCWVRAFEFELSVLGLEGLRFAFQFYFKPDPAYNPKLETQTLARNTNPKLWRSTRWLLCQAAFGVYRALDLVVSAFSALGLIENKRCASRVYTVYARFHTDGLTYQSGTGSSRPMRSTRTFPMRQNHNIQMLQPWSLLLEALTRGALIVAYTSLGFPSIMRV